MNVNIKINGKNVVCDSNDTVLTAAAKAGINIPTLCYLKDVNKITLVFIGTGFLRYMVRNMVGTLIEIGEGKRRSEEIIDILKSEDRTQAGKTANPEGLYLRNVFY